MPEKLLVIGNCQAQFLESLFTVASPMDVVRVPANFLLKDADRADIERKLLEASVIFIQRTSDDYHLEWLRSGVVAARYGQNTWIWPNLYFDGYFPNTRYIYLEGWGKLQSPLEDYHFPPVLDAFKAGQSADEGATRLMDDPCGVLDAFDASLANLRHRENDCSVLISDAISSEIFKTKCFYTPNHPSTTLLVEMARRLADAAGMPFDAGRASAFGMRLDKIDIPIFSWVMRKYKLSFDNSPLYKGVSVESIEKFKLTLGRTAHYLPLDLVKQFYRIYEVALPRRVTL